MQANSNFRRSGLGRSIGDRTVLPILLETHGIALVQPLLLLPVLEKAEAPRYAKVAQLENYSWRLQIQTYATCSIAQEVQRRGSTILLTQDCVYLYNNVQAGLSCGPYNSAEDKYIKG